jgi:hypothetical protein
MGLALGRGAASLGRRWIGAAQGRGRRLWPDNLAARPIGPRRHHFIEVVEKIAKRGRRPSPCARRNVLCFQGKKRLTARALLAGLV